MFIINSDKVARESNRNKKAKVRNLGESRQLTASWWLHPSVVTPKVIMMMITLLKYIDDDREKKRAEVSDR